MSAADWITAILALSALIFVHEWGHYITARIGGMHVDRFSILGIGPVLVRLFTYKGCEFVISAIPIGAYVHIVGMESEEDEEEARKEQEEKDAKKGKKKKKKKKEADEQDGEPERKAAHGYRNFRDSPMWARVFSIAGGPLANYLAAMIIAICVFSFAGTQNVVGVKFGEFGEQSPAEAAGLQIDDEFVSFAGEPIRGSESVQKVLDTSAKHLGEEIDVVVLRAGEEQTFAVTLNEQAPALSTQLVPIGDWEPLPPGEALVMGAKYPYVQTGHQLSALWKMITGQREGRVGGPVAIVTQMASSSRGGLASFMLFAALISALLGMFNLLPIPALDGGRLLFMLFEIIFRRPVPKAIEERVHMVGLIGLFGLIIYATVGDVGNLMGSDHDWKREVNDVKAEIIEADNEAKATGADEPQAP